MEHLAIAFNRYSALKYKWEKRYKTPWERDIAVLNLTARHKSTGIKGSFILQDHMKMLYNHSGSGGINTGQPLVTKSNLFFASRINSWRSASLRCEPASRTSSPWVCRLLEGATARADESLVPDSRGHIPPPAGVELARNLAPSHYGTAWGKRNNR